MYDHDDEELREMDARRKLRFKAVAIVVAIGMVLLIANLFFALVLSR